ncbi:MAG: histidinol dehydrogenase [Proteobacteria bacterium]|nr:histidinol dehydrogenase [Pseudomonadota bacterium]
MNISVFEVPKDEKSLISRLKPRCQLLDRSLVSDISAIFKNVEESGDKAIKDATFEFDKLGISSVSVSKDYINASIAKLSSEFKTAINTAIDNIKEVNEALMPEMVWTREIRPGTTIGEKSNPLEAVGIYVPATKGPLVSTALMLVTAAKVAGVKRIVVGMPPRKDGKADASTIAAAHLAGAHQIVTGNGVALVAGLTIGTESIPEVDGIYGPGPPGIAAAMSVAFSYGKRTVVGIGPTDCAVIADDTANARFIAKDLLSEAEHGPDSSALFVTTSRNLAEEVAKELNHRIPEIEENRKHILGAVYGDEGMGVVVYAPDTATACRIVNEYAPEHLLINCSDQKTQEVLSKVEHAGEILLGDYTPFSAANYAIGITAVLPTNSFARSFSGITCKDMLKTTTIGKLSKAALARLRPSIEEIGKQEGLPCHVDAVTARF